MNLPRILGVIPSRFASTRLAGKPLLDICGKPMVEHVYRRALASGVFFRVVIATDDERIYNAAEKFGGDVLITRADHPDGSSRVAEVARSIDTDYVINIQGDEPMLDPRMLRELAEGIVSDPGADSATVCVPITSEKDFNNPNIVKVVTDQRGRALYFSRSPIPFRRNIRECPVWEHLGIYAFTKKFFDETKMKIENININEIKVEIENVKKERIDYARQLVLNKIILNLEKSIL